MTPLNRVPPRDDAELAARIEVETRPAPFAPSELARFRVGVEARLAPEPSARRWWAWGFAASTATAAIALGIATRSPTPSPVSEETSPSAADYFAESYEEQVLFAPEWIQRDQGFVDAEVLPEDYALASALIEP